MRTTLNLNDTIFKKASLLTGITQKTSLIHKGLEALIGRESSRRLAVLGGSERFLRPISRKRAPR